MVKLLMVEVSQPGFNENVQHDPTTLMTSLGRSKDFKFTTSTKTVLQGPASIFGFPPAPPEPPSPASTVSCPPAPVVPLLIPLRAEFVQALTAKIAAATGA